MPFIYDLPTTSPDATFLLLYVIFYGFLFYYLIPWHPFNAYPSMQGAHRVKLSRRLLVYIPAGYFCFVYFSLKLVDFNGNMYATFYKIFLSIYAVTPLIGLYIEWRHKIVKNSFLYYHSLENIKPFKLIKSKEFENPLYIWRSRVLFFILPSLLLAFLYLFSLIFP
jgi:hypothetical protein